MYTQLYLCDQIDTQYFIIDLHSPSIIHLTSHHPLLVHSMLTLETCLLDNHHA